MDGNPKHPVHSRQSDANHVLSGDLVSHSDEVLVDRGGVQVSSLGRQRQLLSTIDLLRVLSTSFRGSSVGRGALSVLHPIKTHQFFSSTSDHRIGVREPTWRKVMNTTTAQMVIRFPLASFCSNSGRTDNRPQGRVACGVLFFLLLGARTPEQGFAHDPSTLVRWHGQTPL